MMIDYNYQLHPGITIIGNRCNEDSAEILRNTFNDQSIKVTEYIVNDNMDELLVTAICISSDSHIAPYLIIPQFRKDNAKDILLSDLIQRYSGLEVIKS